MKGAEEGAEASCLAPDSNHSNHSDTETLIHQQILNEDDRVAYSESVYSDTVSQEGSNGSGETISRPAYLTDIVGTSADPQMTYQPTNYRINSSISSVDWKTWLSANDAKQELSPSRLGRIKDGLPTSIPPRHGHVREGAEVDDEIDLTQPAGSPTRSPSPSALPLATIEPNVVKKLYAQGQTRLAAVSPIEKMAENDDPRYSRSRPSNVDKSGKHSSPIPAKNGPRSASSDQLKTFKSPRILNRTETKGSGSSEGRPEQPGSASPIPRLRRLRPAKSSSRSPLAVKQSPSGLSRREQQEAGGATWSPPVAFCQASSPGSTTTTGRRLGDFGTWEEELGAETGDVFYDERNSNARDSPAPSRLDGVQYTGSKKMVDLFLNSRRRRMVSGAESGAFI